MSTTCAASPLRQLEAFGQSPWLDFIRRGFIADGSLRRLAEADGLKGITSNPSIFEKAMGEGTDYDEGFRALAAEGDRALWTSTSTWPSKTSGRPATSCGR